MANGHENFVFHFLNGTVLFAILRETIVLSPESFPSHIFCVGVTSPSKSKGLTASRRTLHAASPSFSRSCDKM